MRERKESAVRTKEEVQAEFNYHNREYVNAKKTARLYSATLRLLEEKAEREFVEMSKLKEELDEMNNEHSAED